MTQGRHCIGRPGLGRRDITMILAASDVTERRPRHRRGRSGRRSTEAAGIFAAAAVLAMLAVSGWYTASGATAVVQMLAR